MSFEETFGKPTGCRQATPGAIKKHSKALPAALIARWKREGFCGYGGGLLWFTDPDDLAEPLEDWLPTLREWGVSKGARVILRGAFGHLYLWDKRSAWSFDPLGLHGGGAVSKVVDDIAFLLDDLLTMPELQEKILMKALFEKARKKHGPLAWDECFTFNPAPALGGSVKLEAIKRAKLREYLAILAGTGS